MNHLPSSGLRIKFNLTSQVLIVKQHFSSFMSSVNDHFSPIILSVNKCLYVHWYWEGRIIFPIWCDETEQHVCNWKSQLTTIHFHWYRWVKNISSRRYWRVEASLFPCYSAIRIMSHHLNCLSWRPLVNFLDWDTNTRPLTQSCHDATHVFWNDEPGLWLPRGAQAELCRRICRLCVLWNETIRYDFFIPVKC